MFLGIIRGFWYQSTSGEAITIMSDSDNTASVVEADYDDFISVER